MESVRTRSRFMVEEYQSCLSLYTWAQSNPIAIACARTLERQCAFPLQGRTSHLGIVQMLDSAPRRPIPLPSLGVLGSYDSAPWANTQTGERPDATRDIR